MKHLLARHKQVVGLAVGALTALFSFTPVQAAQSSIMHSAASGNNYIAYYLTKTRYDAQQYCLSKGGHLAVVNSNGEATDIKRFLDTTPPGSIYWLGSTIAESAYTPTTITGQRYFEPTTVGTVWERSPGSNYMKQTYDLAYGQLVYHLSSLPDQYFICEFEANPI